MKPTGPWWIESDSTVFLVAGPAHPTDSPVVSENPQ